MLNTFILMVALATTPATAKGNDHKSHKNTKQKTHAVVKTVKHQPRSVKSQFRSARHGHKHGHHAAHWTWTWSTGYYDVHGHWIRGKWVWTLNHC